MVVRRSDARTSSRPPLNTSTYKQCHGNSCTELSKVERPHKKGADEYEAEGISEAEPKREQRKARAKADASPAELSSSDLPCSVCNMQFIANIGLIRHLRTHKQ